MNGAHRLVALVGPTAAGKTRLALQVAREIDRPVEVVSLDSRQLYRHLDVGTGKPTVDELAALPHHLVNSIDPDETFDAGRYRRAVEELLPQLWERGVTPLVVGGAGFYLRALTEGFFALPGAGEELEAVRESLADRSLDELRTELARIDPDSSAQIHSNDRYRISRALEIHRLTGRRLSELTREFRPAPVLDCRFAVVHLSPDRADLHAWIEARAATWLEKDWPEEVERLLDGGWSPDAPGLNILGYDEVQRLVRGEIEPTTALERVVVATRRYARQQEIWFRKTDTNWRGDPRDRAAHQALLGLLREETDGRA